MPVEEKWFTSQFRNDELQAILRNKIQANFTNDYKPIYRKDLRDDLKKNDLQYNKMKFKRI